MTRDQHLQFCKKCDNKKLDLERGLVCSLTNEFADFSVSCDNFSEITSITNKPEYTYSNSNKVYDVTAGKRFANYFIDRIVLLGLGGLFGALLGALWMVIAPEQYYDLEMALENKIIQYLFGFVIGFIYYSFIESVSGRSIGKFFTKTKVVTEDGERPDVSTILLRSICRFIPFEAFSFLGGEPRGWHDTISKTRVVDIDS